MQELKGINKIAILGGVMLAMLLSALDQTIVSTAMPKIVSELNGFAHLSWVFTAYMLTSTITVPIYGKLSDLFGRRSFFIIGIVIFLIGSALAGLANSMLLLILFRGVQGIGAGAIMVNAFAIIGEVFPPHERGKFQGMIGGVFGLASIAGPLLGGWITDYSSWRWIFYINIPLGILAIIVLAFVLPKITHDPSKKRSIDYLGGFLLALTLTPSLLALVWGGSQYAWGSTQIQLLLTLALAGFISFILVEERVQDPILSLSLFKNRTFVVSTLATFFTGMGMFGAILYIPLFAQGVIGTSATNSGLIMTPMMAGLIVASIISGQLISRTGKYKILAIVGIAITAASMFWFSTISISTSSVWLSARMVTLGVGLGITMPLFTIAVQNAFTREKLGEVTAGLQLFRSIGGTVGTAIFGGIMNSGLASRLQNISSDPFVMLMKKLDPTTAIANVNNTTVQSILNPQLQSQITAGFKAAPDAIQSTLTLSFAHFIDVVKLAFTQSLDQIFLVGTLLMTFSLFITFFLPQLEIKRPKRPVLEEAGIELEEELGQSDSMQGAI